MADDIDIEEHDVMDNPVIRSIFPDLSVLKKEFLHDYDEAFMVDQNKIKVEEHLNCNNSDRDIDLSCISNVGTGPFQDTTYIQCEKTNEPLVYDINSDPPLFKNKIILGSKPSKVIKEKDQFRNKKKLFTATVMLTNLRPYLDSCKKYCEICFILFPNKKALDVHKQSLHCYSTTNESKLNNMPEIDEEAQSKRLCVNKPKCNICHKYFASHSSLSKHKRNIHFIKTKNVKMRVCKNKKGAIQISSGNRNKNSLNSTNSCFHCKGSFPNMQLLIEHLYETLQNKKDTANTQNHNQNFVLKIPEKTGLGKFSNKEKPINGSNSNVYRCPVCSYYFNNEKYSSAHLFRKHNMKNKNPLKKVVFDPKCKFCSSEFRSVVTYNKHIQKVHKKLLLRALKTKPSNKSSMLPSGSNQIKNIVDKLCNKPILQEAPNENPSFISNTDNGVINNILKSTLYRCNRCDVHFLRSQVAIDHSSHMEILINWKCSLCNRIFKKNDELFHRQQHLVTNDFTVYGISESTPSIFLYKCPKCTVHFSENIYLEHFSVCETVPSNHVQCKSCDILINRNIKSIHEDHHRSKAINSKDFVIIRTEVINNGGIDENLCNGEQRQLRTRGVMVHNSYEAQIKKLKLDNLFTVYYCHTCKCFVNDGTKLIHKKAQCTNVVPATCKLCGLIITQTGISSHGRLHQRKKNLTLQDFKFYDLKNKKLIAPPIPEFPHCNICGIYFANQIAKIRHECGVDDYVTCSYCELNFSELGYKLHMNYHNYKLQSRTIEQNSLPQSVPVSKIKPQFLGKVKPILTANALESKLDYEESEKFIVYTCKNCHISMDAYDLVVEHCQGHYNPIKIQSSTNICEVCDLIFDAVCYDSHEKLHLCNNFKKTFKVIKFDIFYFTSDYDAWIKRVFDSLPQEHVQTIINKSIYKYENKIKMKVIQEAPPNFTVYQCDKCRCFIDPSSLFKHLGNHCLTLRKHTCRTCGIPFISVTSKLQHEAIHKQPFKGLKSYRIVLFNRDEDKMFNDSLRAGNWFTLYKCRNCEGVVSKSDFKNHLCNRSDLKKCSHCGLLLYNKEYNLHISKHKEFDSFNAKNIKVILIGRKNEDSKMLLDVNLVSSFNGKVYDYSFYRCKKCQMCMRNARSTLKHDCSFEIPKSKCSYCGLHFDARKLKHHYVLHETDCNFVIDNITIIDFEDIESHKGNSNLSKKSYALKESIVEDEKTDELKESGIVLPVAVNSLDSKTKCMDSRTDVIEKTAKLYKCSCGLHFLDNSVMTHINICSTKNRISRQHCSKCGLTFSPNVLFKHLLTHHGNKNIVYNFDIVEVLKEKS